MNIARDLDGRLATSTEGAVFEPSSGDAVPADEPLFVLRGRDNLALRLLDEYVRQSVEDGCNDYHFDKLEQAIRRFKAFADKHPDRMKQPSVTRGL